MPVRPPWHNTDEWKPTQFVRFERGLDTSMGTAEIITDAEPPFAKAYIKAMGNRQGPHALASEFVATQLAQWFALPVFDFAIIQIDAEVDEIRYVRGGNAGSGPAFVTKALKGFCLGW